MEELDGTEGQSSLAPAESVIEMLSHLRVDANQLDFHESATEDGSLYTSRVAEFKPVSESSGTLVYVKQLRHRKQGRRNLEQEQLLRLARQLKVWAGLNHPNILPLVGFFLDDGHSEAWIIVPWLARGNLQNYIIQFQPEDTERLKLATEIALGVNYLHHQVPPIAHGDIRASNVFMNDEGRAVIGDFGLARVVQDRSTGLTTTNSNGGAIRWMSMELLLGDEHGPTTHSDVWAWRCLLLEILTGKVPYSSFTNLAAVVVQICLGILPAAVESLQVPDALRRLLSQCWSRDIKNRPRMEIVAATLIEVTSRSLRSSNIFSLTDSKGNLLGSLQHVEVVYRGPLSDVAKALWVRADAMSCRVAVKYLRPHEYRHNLLVEKILAQQVVRWGTLDHRNLLPVLGMMDKPRLCLLFPWCANGDLSQYLQNNQTVNIADKLRLLKQVASAVVYLHSQSPSIIHHKIGMEHILLNSSGEALLSGCHLEDVLESLPNTQEDGGPSISWLVPEELNGSEPTTASDVYSFGSVMLEVLSEKRPFWKLSPGWTIIRKASGHLPSRLDHPLLPVSDPLWDLIESAMATEPSERPVMKVVLNDLNIHIIGHPTVIQSNEVGSEDARSSYSKSDTLSFLDPSSTSWPDGDEAAEEITGNLLVEKDAPVWTGGFADVCKATWDSETGRQLVAIKYLRAPNSSNSNQDARRRKAKIAQLVKREAFIWSRAKHRYIAPLLGIGLGARPCLVSPWYENGNLADFISRNPELSVSDKLRLVFQTAEALAYLHSLEPPITHGDIKPSNVLINDKIEAQLSDFGLSQLLQDSTETTAVSAGPIGTKGYQAPELIFGGTCTLKTDVFALGSCLVTAISGYAPFQNLNGPRTVLALNKGQLPSHEMHPGLTPALWDIVGRCWSLDPPKRPTAREIAEELEKELVVLGSPKAPESTADSSQDSVG